MLMNDASSTLYSEARGLEMPCVCLSDLLAVQEALKRFVAVLQKGHLPPESHRVGLDEAAAEHQLSEGLQPVKVGWEQGAAPLLEDRHEPLQSFLHGQEVREAGARPG